NPWWVALEPRGAPKIIARLPFIERADHPAALPVFVVSRVADSAMVTEVEMWSVRVSGWNAEIARALSPLAEIVAVPDTAFDGAALLASVAGPANLEKIKTGLIEAGASVRSSALVGSHATRYTVPANGAVQYSAAAAGDWPRLRARSRSHHLRCRVRRDSQSAGAHLSEPRRRGDQHHSRLSGVSNRHQSERRRQCRRTRNQFYRRRRCHPEAGLDPNQAGVARKPEQPDRNVSAVRRGQTAARRTACACTAGARCGVFGLRLAQRLRALQ